MDLRTREVLPRRRGADVDESPRRGADDDDPVLQLVGAERAADHVGRRDVAKAALAAVRNERRHPLVERNAHSVADVHEAHPPELPSACVDDGRLDLDRRVAEVDAKDGQRHRLEEAVSDLHEHGHAARDTVRVERLIQMSRGGRRRLQRRDVAAVTGSAEIAVLRVGESGRSESRARQDTRSFSLRAHQEPEDHRMLLDLFGEAPVVVERGAHPLQKSLKRRVVAQFAGGGRFEDRQAGVRAPSRKRQRRSQRRAPGSARRADAASARACRGPRASVPRRRGFFRRCRRSRCVGRAFAAGTGVLLRRRPRARAGSAHGPRSSPRRPRARRRPAPVRSRPERGHSVRTSGSSGRSIPRGALCGQSAKHKRCRAAWGIFIGTRAPAGAPNRES